MFLKFLQFLPFWSTNLYYFSSHLIIYNWNINKNYWKNYITNFIFHTAFGSKSLLASALTLTNWQTCPTALTQFDSQVTPFVTPKSPVAPYTRVLLRLVQTGSRNRLNTWLILNHYTWLWTLWQLKTWKVVVGKGLAVSTWDPRCTVTLTPLADNGTNDDVIFHVMVLEVREPSYLIGWRHWILIWSAD